jgi:hypothetical protein
MPMFCLSSVTQIFLPSRGRLWRAGPHRALAVVLVRMGLRTRPTGMSQEASGEPARTGAGRVTITRNERLIS